LIRFLWHPARVAIIAFWFASLSAVGQTASATLTGITPCAGFKPGVVVEAIAERSEGKRAGLAQGDVILAWVQGDQRGEIVSPFDLATVELEIAPRGTVTLQGTTGTRKQTWVVGPDKWGLEVRPLLPSDLLLPYNDAQRLAKSEKFNEAIAQWRLAAALAGRYDCSWLSAWLLLDAAEMLVDAGKINDANGVYQEAIRAAKITGPVPTIQLPLMIGDKLFGKRDFAAAKTYYEQVVSDGEALRLENLALGKAVTNLGAIAYNRGDPARAEQFYHRAFAIDEKLAPDSLEAATSLSGLGSAAWLRGDLKVAEDYFEKALLLRKRLAPGGLDVATSLNALGAVAKRRGDLSKAEDLNRQALAIREELAPGSLDVATSLNNLGNIALNRGDLFEAEKLVQQALSLRKKLAPDSLEVAICLDNLGNISWPRGDLVKAEEYHQDALKIRQQLAPNSVVVASSLTGLGIVAFYRGDFVKAEDYYHRAADIQEMVAPGSLGFAESLNNLGVVDLDRGDLTGAEAYLQKSLAIKRKLAPNSLNVAGTLDSLGALEILRGETTQAENYLNEALTIHEKAHSENLALADIVGNLAVLARDQEDLPKAKQYYERALAIQAKLAPGGSQVAETFNNLGDLSRRRKDFGNAEENYRQAVAIRKALGPSSAAYGESLASLAEVFWDDGNLKEAGPLFEQALDVLESQTARLGGSGEVRSDFRAQHAGYYMDYVDLLMRQKQPELAFDVLERSRAQTLLETLSEAHADIHHGADPSLLGRERLLQATLRAKTNRRIDLLQEGKHTEELAAINKEIDELLTEYGEIESRIRATSPRYAALTQPKPLSAKEVQLRLLDADSLLLEYALGKERSYVFALTATSLDAYELPKRADIESIALQLHDLLTWGKVRLAKAEADYRMKASQLSRMVMGPVAGRLGRKRLLIVSDGVLQYIPFAILPLPDLPSRGDAKASKQPAPLVAEHEIVNLPSATVLAVLRLEQTGRGAVPPKAVAVLADPVFDKNDPRVHGEEKQGQSAKHALTGDDLHCSFEGRAAEPAPKPDTGSLSGDRLTRSVGDVGLRGKEGASLPRLPCTRREAAAIVALTPKGQGLQALDFRASRETATSPELAQFRIVHFATHGLLDSKHPELSGLVLSLVDEQGKPRNGFLDLEDVYNLNLPADLVVLSACETALGKEIAGEGLVGLTRGFMYAGAPRVIASLWEVDDVATSELMAHFYRGILQQGKTPAAALRQAQLELRKQKRWNAPYYWGAFTLQGEWR